MANRPCDRLLSFSVTYAVDPSSALRLSHRKAVSNLLVYPCAALDFFCAHWSHECGHVLGAPSKTLHMELHIGNF